MVSVALSALQEHALLGLEAHLLHRLLEALDEEPPDDLALLLLKSCLFLCLCVFSRWLLISIDPEILVCLFLFGILDGFGSGSLTPSSSL